MSWGLGHASLESVQLADGVPDTGTRAFPEEEKDTRRMASEAKCQFRNMAVLLTSFVAARPQFFACKMGMLVSVLNFGGCT